MSAAPSLSVIESGPQELPPVPLTYPALPHLIEAEQAVLGTMMVVNKTVAQIAAVVAEADFYETLHQRVFAAALRIDAEKRPVTPLTLRTALGDDPGLKEIGWTYLADLADAGSSIGEREAVALARDIAATAIRRRAMSAIWEAQEELAAPPKRPVTDILAPVVRAADEAAEQGRGADPAVSECAYAFLRELEEGKHAVPAFKTGMTKLDDELGGFFPADLIIVGGRPGMMKSALLTCLARAAAFGGNRVDIFSIEMSRRDNMARMLCDIDYDSHPENPLWYKKLTRGRTTPNERERAAQAAVELGRLRIDIHDMGTISAPQITAIARARASRFGKPAMIGVDHLQIVEASGSARDNRTTELTRATNALKALAKMLECPVVLLSQLNRDVEKRGDKERMPTLADLRESGSIEQDADLIIMLYRPAFYLWQKKPRDPLSAEMDEWKVKYDMVANDLEISVPKNRHGPMFDCRLHVEPGAAAIRDEKPAPPSELAGLL